MGDIRDTAGKRHTEGVAGPPRGPRRASRSATTSGSERHGAGQSTSGPAGPGEPRPASLARHTAELPHKRPQPHGSPTVRPTNKPATGGADPFRVGTRIEHPELGAGRVVRAHEDRLEVRFEDTTRVLTRSALASAGTRANGAKPAGKRPRRAKGASSAPKVLPGPKRRVTAIEAGRPGNAVAAAKPAGMPAPATGWAWAPPELLRDLRADGFQVTQGPEGYRVKCTPAAPFNLLHLRVTATGEWQAAAVGNQVYGRTDAFKAVAPAVKTSIEQALRRGSKASGTGPLRKVLRDGRARLLAAAAKHAREGDFERRHREIQAGAPGLGKRA